MAAIREDIIIDPTRGIQGLTQMERATIKYARKQKKAYEDNQRSIRGIEKELETLRRARENANRPEFAERYTKAIQRLEGEQKRLTAETEKFATTTRDASQNTGKWYERIGKSAKTWIAGAAVTAFLLLQRTLRSATNTAREADAAFTRSFAIQTGLSEQYKQRMKRIAQDVANDMNMGIETVAGAYEYLALAGLDAEQQIAALPQVAAFAKAGMFDLSLATDLLTDAQSALGMTVRDDVVANMQNMQRLSDVLVKGNTLANASVQQFSESLANRFGAALRLVNKDVEEGVALLAALADQGTKGAEAGTRMDIVLRDLQRSALNNREAFASLGITVFDSEGRMRAIADIIEDIESALDGLSDEQSRATITLLGFQERSVSAILQMLGLSDAIRDYEEKLRDAGGTTRDVAENQMKSLEERINALTRAAREKFGPAMEAVMERFVGMLERALATTSRLIDRFKGSEVELESILRRAGASPEVLQQLEQDRAIRDARKLKERLEKELEGATLPVTLEVEETEPQSFLGSLNPQGLFRAVFGRDHKVHLGTVLAESMSLDDVQEVIDNARARLERISAAARDAAARGTEAGDRRQKELVAEAEGLERVISMNEEYLAKQRELAAVKQALEEATRESTQVVEEEAEATEKASGAVEAYVRQRVQGSHRAVEAVSELGAAIRYLSEFDMTEHATTGQMDKLARDFEDYKNQVLALNNELSAGHISQQEYGASLERLGNQMRQQLLRVYNTLRHQLTPAQRKAWQSMIEGIDGAGDSVEDLEFSLRDLADAASSVLTLADAFGAVDDNIRNVVRGAIEVMRNIDNLKAASGLAAIVPGLGVAAGAVSVFAGLMGGGGEEARRQRERMLELQNSLNSLRRAVDRNTQAFYADSVVGSGVSAQDIRRGGELAGSLDTQGARRRIEDAWRGVDHSASSRRHFQQTMMEERARMVSILEEMGEIFPELFGDAAKMFLDTLEAEGWDAAFGYVDTLPAEIRRLQGAHGGYGDSLDGAIAQYTDAIRFGGAGVKEAMQAFLSTVMGLDGVSEGLKKKLESIAGLDLSTEEGKKQLEEIIAAIFAAQPELIGDMTPDDFRQLLEFLQRMGDESVQGSETDAFSRSVQIARTITDVQANEVVMLLEAIEYWVRQTAALLGDGTAGSLPPGAFGGGYKPFELPVPVQTEVTNWQQPEIFVEVHNEVQSPQTHNYAMTINVSAPAGSDPGGIDYDSLGRNIGRQFHRETLARKF